MLEFQVGDKAVYPAQGVAEVVGIDAKEISGKIQKFYVLKVLDSDMRILVPIEKAEQVGLREVVQEDQIREVYDILKEKELHIDKQTWNRRYRGFMEKIKTGSLFEVAEVCRDLYRLKETKTLSFGERRMLDTARSLIVKEIAIAREQTEEQVKTEIEAIFVSN
jgi:CarD family transcriptional regulator